MEIDKYRSKVATVSHNTSFTSRDLKEYSGNANLLSALKRKKFIKSVGKGKYYPTSDGWKWIEGEISGDLKKNPSIKKLENWTKVKAVRIVKGMLQILK